jgi:hypothetical protein
MIDVSNSPGAPIMRKFVLLLLAVMMVPNFTSNTSAAPKHGKKLQAKMNELGHKKRMKKAAKQDKGAKKGLLHH